MRKLLFPLLLVATFSLGFAAASLTSEETPQPVGRVTGVGGIFFKAQYPDSLKKWYSSMLGMNMDKYGTNFVWFQGADSTKPASTQWSVFKATTKYFEPSKKEFMLNYRVDNLEVLLKKLTENKVTICDTMETYDYGKFIHIMDPEGNKIELWEPVDATYYKYIGASTK